MAEFKEVVRRRNEMCEYYSSCDECPLCSKYCNSFLVASYEDIEEIVMNWEEPIKELTIEEAKKLPQGLEIEVRDDEDDEWHLRDFVTAYKGLFWCECSSDSTALISWRHARLKEE